MTISEFAQKLYPYCNKGENTGEFLINLIEASVREADNKFFDRSNDYYTRLYNGRTFPKKTAQFITANFDSEKLDNTFLNDRPTEDALIKLCEIFTNEIGVSTKDDVATKLAQLFFDIVSAVATENNNQTNTKITTSSQLEMEQALLEIMNELEQIPFEQINESLNFNPINIDKKIPNTLNVLKHSVRENVIAYYKPLQKLFHDKCQYNTEFFNDVAKMIKRKSDQLISETNSLETIFNSLVNWLSNLVCTTNLSACRVIISFFIQNCEVFHEITQ